MTTTPRSLAAAALTVALIAAPSAADAQPVRYRVVPLPEIVSAQTSCVPTAINANGDVVGYCGAGGDSAIAVLWRGGTVANLGLLQDGIFAHAFSINAAGTIIVGDGDDGDLRNKALVKKGSGPWIQIDGSGGSYQGAYSVTDAGVIFGNYSTAGSPGLETWDPVFWTFDAGHNRYDRHDLPTLIGTPTTGFSGAFVYAASRLGVAVGQATSDLEGVHAALWQNDAAHTLIALRNPIPGGAGIALAVSDDGRAVGRFYGASQPDQAVLWLNDAAHSPVILGTLPGDAKSTAFAVNVNGQVVGASFAAGPSAARGFIYQNGAIKDLSSLLDSEAAGWSINEPAGINNGGTIVATATLNGVRHPVMLVPFTPGPITSVTLGASHSAPQLAGTSITFNAAAAGGASPYEFKFLLSDGASTSVVQDWSASSSFTWTPASADPDYQVLVWARSDGNTADAAEQSASLAFPIFSLVDSVAIGSDLASPQTAGATITFTASASGGTAPYQFRWSVSNGTSESVVQDWSSSNTLAWTPDVAGNYIVTAGARSAGSAADAPEQSASLPFQVARRLISAVSMSADLASPQVLGASITFSASATGGTAPYQFKWLVIDGTSNTVAQDWSPAASFTWTPSAANANYGIVVLARSADATGDAGEQNASMDFAIVRPVVSAVSLDANLPSPQVLGASIVFTAAATGGAAPYEFKYLVGGAVAQDWSPSASFTWTPSAAGTYQVAVWVRGAGNTDDAAEQSASTSFTIEVVPPPPPPVDGCKPLPGDRHGKGAPDFNRGHKGDDCDPKDTKESKDTKEPKDTNELRDDSGESRDSSDSRG